MKICIVIPSLKQGGMERAASEIANFMANDKSIETHLVMLDDETEIAYELNPKIIVHRVGVKHSTLTILLNLRKKLKFIRPYSILSFGSMYNSFTMLSSLFLNCKRILTDRSNPYRNTYFTFKKGGIERHDGLLHYLLKQILYRRADAIIVQTKIAAEIERKSLKHKRIVHIPNPIKKIQNKIDNKTENYVLNVGRFIESKKQIELIEIFSKVNSILNWKLVFAGDGPELQSCIGFAKKRGIMKRCIFLGAVIDIDYWYNRSKIFAFTSVSEGFPNALGEAMSAGLACISYDCVAGPSDLITDGINGYLVSVNDKFVYKDKLEKLLNDPNLRKQFGEKGKEKIVGMDRISILQMFKQEITI